MTSGELRFSWGLVPRISSILWKGDDWKSLKGGGDVKEKSAIPKDKLAMHWASLTPLYSIDSTDGSSMLPCRREGHFAD
ncbi:hypothetical protein NPIL_53221 [Nephila pilipes]|uniref:Uncharacterized protein n=1 Tax=Nephila pilipes TaxID=299642 RepID=A0A8X6TF30_NEPPI|nr:hypothetical protein NPIL_53221 [Nephila pilipes]